MFRWGRQPFVGSRATTSLRTTACKATFADVHSTIVVVVVVAVAVAVVLLSSIYYTFRFDKEVVNGN